MPERQNRMNRKENAARLYFWYGNGTEPEKGGHERRGGGPGCGAAQLRTKTGIIRDPV